MKITIEPYTATWDLNYQKLRGVIRNLVKGLDTDIQHVGSTSVPGLAAKPIIDIDIIVDNVASLPSITEKLEAVGYRSLGSMGIPGRYAFSQNRPSVPFGDKDSIYIKHNLYVCEKNSTALKNHLLFRDYLRNNTDAVMAYSALKYKIAAQTTDIDQYVAQKTEFIISILIKCGLTVEALQEIRTSNTNAKRIEP